MKNLKYFGSFSINEELKYSETLFTQLTNKWKKLMDEVNEIEDYNLTLPKDAHNRKEGLDRLMKACEKYHTEWQIPINEIIYEDFNKKIGGIVFDHLQNAQHKNKSEFQEFNLKLKKSLQTKNIDPLSEEWQDCNIKLKFQPFYQDDEHGGASPIGTLRTFKNNDSKMIEFILKTNMFYALNPIRHELQHLTQYVNNLCIIIGDHVKKDYSFLEKYLDTNVEVYRRSLDVKLSEFLKECFDTPHRWGGKMKTGWKRSGIIGKTTVEDFSKLKKELEDMGLSKDTEMNLLYYGSDMEYKPQIEDVVDDSMEIWLRQNRDKLQALSNLYKRFGEEELNVDKINNYTKEILEICLKDERAIIMKKVRKQIVTNDLYKLINKKLKNLITK